MHLGKLSILGKHQKFEVAGVGSGYTTYGALEAFRKRDEIDSSNIWQIGFSLGGEFALAIDENYKTISKK